MKAGATITEHRLKNGLRVLIAERHLDPVVAVMTWYRVGARNEREEESGVSHFLEHMMFKGSRGFGKGEVDTVTTLLGGQNNAFTSPDHTAYWFELASDRWEKALEIEADRMRNLTLDRGEFDSERAVVLEELAMGEDDPWRHLSRRVQTMLFPRHPYRRPVIGYADTLQAMDVGTMRSYYERFYHPGNATVVICGDVEPAGALRLVRKHFGTIPRGADYEQADCYRAAPEEPAGERRLSVQWSDPGRRLCIAWPAAPVGSDDDYALDLVATILTGGRLSRLHHELVIERGLATTVSADNDARIDGGVFWLFAECARDAEPAELEAAIDAQLERLADETVPAPELKRAKAMLLSSDAHHSETVSDLAEDLGSFAVDADWRLAVEGARRHQRVKAAALRDVAGRLLGRGRRVVGWSLPQDAAPAGARSGNGRGRKR